MWRSPEWSFSSSASRIIFAASWRMKKWRVLRTTARGVSSSSWSLGSASIRNSRSSSDRDSQAAAGPSEDSPGPSVHGLRRTPRSSSATPPPPAQANLGQFGRSAAELLHHRLDHALLLRRQLLERHAEHV